MQLIIDTANTTISNQSGRFFIKDEKRQSNIAPQKISSIAIHKNSVMITAGAVQLAIEQQIPILFFNRHGRLKGRLWSPYFGSIATLRRKQMKFAETTHATAWIIQTFQDKLEGQLKLLNWLANRKPGYQKQIKESAERMQAYFEDMNDYQIELITDSRKNMQGKEGIIAKTYWQCLSKVLQDKVLFEKRSRRPAEDIFNAAINYLYGMLYPRVEGALMAAGLDAHLGFLHSDEYNKPTLSFDMIEPFRPWVDRLVVDWVLGNQLKKSYFDEREGILLNARGKAFMIPKFKKFMKEKVQFNGKRYTRFNHIHYYAKQLASAIAEHDKED